MANKKKNQSKKQSKNTTIKKKNSKKNEVVDMTPSTKSIIWIIIVSMFVFGSFYLLTLYLTRDKTEKDDSNDYYSSPFSTTEIMAGRSFSMGDGEYYVLFYDSSDEDIESTYSSIVSSYRAKSELSIYTVKMDNGLNKGYLKEESNTHPNSASELAINGPTLIKISNHEVALYIEGEESIRSTLE